MVTVPSIPTTRSSADRWRRRLSLSALIVATGLLIATYFLISPPQRPTYPGAREWAPYSLLKPLVDAMSLGGAVSTPRGVEIKDFALHFAAVIGLLMLALRATVSGLLPPNQRTVKGGWFLAQAFLCAWVLIALASALWSGDAAMSRGQAILYGIALAWAVSLSWTLESRDVPRLLNAYVAVAALAAGVCVWYFYERNPFHRPGFPIGNPSSLAIVTLPALFLCGAILAGSLREYARMRTAFPWLRVTLCVIALVPLAVCVWLTDSRGALVGGLLGLSGVLFLVVTRRARMVVAVVLLVLAIVGSWQVSSSAQEVTMARGATIRFRLYNWQYAAQLWQRRPISGMGAGVYPRAAGALSVRDRLLDPAAFMGDVIAHAHNELFEILAEIGLIGGLTFVAGLLATLAAASALLQANLSRQRRWLVLGLTAGVIAMIGDSLFGVGLRLPGAPAVFYTLLGGLWALCRSVSKVRTNEADTTRARSMLRRRAVVTAAALVCAGVLGWASVANIRGVAQETAAMAALEASHFEPALRHTRSAERGLLDPVRILLAREAAARCRFGMAEEAYRAALEARSDETIGDQRRFGLDAHAIAMAKEAYAEAMQMHTQAPTFGRMPTLAARSAETIVALLSADDPDQITDWSLKAWRARNVQRLQRPYDWETLMALLRYPMPLGDHIGLLRDALRTGFPDQEWWDALANASAYEKFDATLVALELAARPYTPQTDLDALVISSAPEMYRLRALYRSAQGEGAGAAEDAARAATLYRPLRSRFPTLYSVALTEQALFVFQSDPRQASRACDLARTAIEALPRIQKQEYETRALPFRIRYLPLLLAADERAAADELLERLFPESPETQQQFAVRKYLELIAQFIADPQYRPLVQRWIDRALERKPHSMYAWQAVAFLAAEDGPDAVRDALRRAREAGVTDDAFRQIQQNLCTDFPQLCDEIMAPPCE